MGNFFDPKKWVTRGRLKRHVEPLLVGLPFWGAEYVSRVLYPRKCPLLWWHSTYSYVRILKKLVLKRTWVTSHRGLETWVTFSAKSGYPHFLV